MPIGATVEIQTGKPTEHWALTVLETMPDAWDVISAENQFNDPPEEGHQFYIVRVRVKYLGPDSNMMFTEVTLKALGNSSVVYETYDPGCGVVPDELDTLTELFTGGQIEGNECWQIASSDADSLVMFAEVGFIDSTRVWFELQ